MAATDMMVLSMDHLEFSSPPGKRLAVLGDPIEHSLSPVMHNAALAHMAATFPEMTEWSYQAIHVPAADLGEALRKLHDESVVGINLTIPHKVEVLGHLESIDATAVRMGAVNTLVRTPAGYRGFNTDGYGIRQGIAEAFDRDLAGADVWIFGAGGAARGILVQCLDSQANRVTVVNRSRKRLDDFRDSLLKQGLDEMDKVRFFTTDNNPEDLDSGAILINATSLGLKTEDQIPVPEASLVPGCFVFDTTYGCSNQLATACSRRGLPYADGLSMLVWQGVRSLEIWSGKPVSPEKMRIAAESELKIRANDG